MASTLSPSSTCPMQCDLVRRVKNRKPSQVPAAQGRGDHDEEDVAAQGWKIATPRIRALQRVPRPRWPRMCDTGDTAPRPSRPATALCDGRSPARCDPEAVRAGGLSARRRLASYHRTSVAMSPFIPRRLQLHPHP